MTMISRTTTAQRRTDWRARFGLTSAPLIALGIIWLIDTGLQAQPVQFTSAFAHSVIDGAAMGQPGPMAASLHWVAGIMAAAPALNIIFVLIQLAIGAGLLWRRTAKPALALSLIWSIGVWYFGDGLGGILTGQASLLAGLPSAPFLYLVVGLCLWPYAGDVFAPPAGGGQSPAKRLWARTDTALARFGRALPVPAWIGLWLFAVLFRLLPAQQSPHAVSMTLSMNAPMAPGIMTSVDHSLVAGAADHGLGLVIALAVAEAFIALGVLSRRLAPAALALGVLLSAAFWLFGQNLGGIYTGMATDIAAAPLYVFLAVIVARRLAGNRGQPARQWLLEPFDRLDRYVLNPANS